MPLNIVDDEGNNVELPEGVSFEKPEDITALAEKAKEHDKITKDAKYGDWSKTREIIEDKDKRIKELEEKAKSFDPNAGKEGGNAGNAGDGGKAEIPDVAKVIDETLAKRESEKVGKYIEKQFDELASGDDNRKKVLKEKYDMLVGSRVITSEEEAKSLLTDAYILANKNKDGNYNPINATAMPGSGGGVMKGNNEDKEKAKANLSAMGYQFKGDPNKI